MTERIVLERNKLYKGVWEQPVFKLAPEFGISDVALKKIFNKLRIPTPPVGYWAKIQHGYKIDRTPLPKLKPGDPDSHVVQYNGFTLSRHHQSFSHLQTQQAFDHAF